MAYIQHILAQNMYYHSKGNKIELRKNHTRPHMTENYQSKLQTLQLHSDAKALFRFPTPFSCAGYKTLLSLGLISFPVSSSVWLVSHNSDICNILEYPVKYSFSFIASLNGFSGPPCKDIPGTCQASMAFLELWMEIPQLLSLTLESKARTTRLELLSFDCCDWNLFPLFNYIFISFLF